MKQYFIMFSEQVEVETLVISDNYLYETIFLMFSDSELEAVIDVNSAANSAN